MQFLVRGRDGARFQQDDDDLHGAHQAYMDNWSAELVARGPTLSADGSQHTGSIHVLAVDDIRTAHTFAFEEPYARAGWFATVSVAPLLECVSGSMWDRPRPAPEQVSTFLHARWSPTRLDELDLDRLRQAFVDANGRPWLFGGLVTTDDGTEVKGAVGAIDHDPTDAERHFASITALTPVPVLSLDVHRWRRGGRDA